MSVVGTAPPDQAAPRRARLTLAALAYATLFSLALPSLLVGWMLRLDRILALPPLTWWSAGPPLVVAGALLVVGGIVALWRDGRGLPMSPFPPARLVVRGVYALVAHPIYVGSGIVCAGVAAWIGSAAGVWVVTPVFAAAMWAFVAGYEADATRTRFGAGPRPLLHWPGSALKPLAPCWRLLCRATEALANSWRERTVGPVRFMSHGIYAAVGAAAGVALAAAMAGPSAAWWLIGLALVAELGAAAWAQIVEGSSQLLRPYGYFGAVTAVLLAVPLAALGGADPWLLLAAFSIGACVTQAFGRVRCLIQGCCHGRPIDAPWGIRYRHPRSRVVRLSDLGGVPLHPTPLYAILASLASCAVLLGLWVLSVPLSFIAGAYLILMGLTRFVEEHYRGEPQTAWVGGLRLYQWLAIAFVLAGAALTAVGGRPAPPPAGLRAGTLGWLALLACITYFAYGVDFPRSSRRFSRLV